MVKADSFGVAVGDVGTTVIRSGGSFTAPTYPVATGLGGICYFKDTIWIAGDGGAIYRSVDNGSTWTSQSWSTAVNFHASFDFSKTNLWVAGDSGIILYSTNSGSAWSKQSNTSKRPVNAIANGYTRADVYAACDSGVILLAYNYGAGGYFAITNPHKFNFHGVAMNATDVFFVGDSGYILHRDVVANTDISDTIIDKGANIFYDIAYANPFIIITGSGGTIRISNDNGTTWISPKSGVTEKLFKVAMSADFISSGIAWAVGENGAFLRTADSGKTWARLDSGVRGTVYAAAISPNGDLYATSSGGKSYRLLSGAAHWTLDSLNAGGAPRLTDIAFDKNGFGLAATYDTIALKTIDSGKTWSHVMVNSTAVQILGIAVWGSTALASASNGAVYHSANKGTTWAATTITNAEPLYDVDMSGNNAIAVGYNGVVFYSTNGGLNWTKAAVSGTSSILYKVRFSTATNAVAVSNTGVIIHTVDGGATWKTVTSGVKTALNDAAFHDDINGIITGDGGVILKTHDGGKTWAKDQSNTLYDLKGAIIADGLTAYVVGSQTTILSTTNSGLPVDLISFAGRRLSQSSVLLDWSVANESNNFGYAIDALSADTWNEIGFRNGMGTTSQSQSYSLTDMNATNDQLHYRLRQIDLDGAEHILGTVAISPGGSPSGEDISIYPNPASSEAKINFTVSSPENVRISIINELSIEQQVVTNTTYQSGSYLLDLDTKNLSTGIYHLVFTTPSRRIVKDFVVMK
ncbi:MAG: YCF48-related protein [Candidatus Kapaibacterium sp.]